MTPYEQGYVRTMKLAGFGKNVLGGALGGGLVIGGASALAGATHDGPFPWSKPSAAERAENAAQLGAAGGLAGGLAGGTYAAMEHGAEGLMDKGLAGTRRLLLRRKGLRPMT